MLKCLVMIMSIISTGTGSRNGFKLIRWRKKPAVVIKPARQEESEEENRIFFSSIAVWSSHNPTCFPFRKMNDGTDSDSFIMDSQMVPENDQVLVLHRSNQLTQNIKINPQDNMIQQPEMRRQWKTASVDFQLQFKQTLGSNCTDMPFQLIRARYFSGKYFDQQNLATSDESSGTIRFIEKYTPRNGGEELVYFVMTGDFAWNLKKGDEEFDSSSSYRPEPTCHHEIVSGTKRYRSRSFSTRRQDSPVLGLEWIVTETTPFPYTTYFSRPQPFDMDPELKRLSMFPGTWLRVHHSFDISRFVTIPKEFKQTYWTSSGKEWTSARVEFEFSVSLKSGDCSTSRFEFVRKDYTNSGTLFNIQILREGSEGSFSYAEVEIPRVGEHYVYDIRIRTIQVDSDCVYAIDSGRKVFYNP